MLLSSSCFYVLCSQCPTPIQEDQLSTTNNPQPTKHLVSSIKHSVLQLHLLDNVHHHSQSQDQRTRQHLDNQPKENLPNLLKERLLGNSNLPKSVCQQLQ